jgi:2-oxoglutarate ferredoxin oxidoreductase subunit delta
MPRKNVASIIINHEWCKRCGICSTFCPKAVFTTDDEGTVTVADLDACIACEICERMCPDLAITLVYSDAPAETERVS